MSNEDIASPIRIHLDKFLVSREPPKTFCPSEVARALSPKELETENAHEWRELMPKIREIVWDLRAQGHLEVLQKGEALGSDVPLDEVRGPIRVRRITKA